MNERYPSEKEENGTHNFKRMKTEVLNKVNRKINLDNQVSNWRGESHGMWSWIKLINQVDDHKLQQLCGTDIALYLVYIRYCAYFFGIISVINILTVVMYFGGTPKPAYDWKTAPGTSILQAVTILNVSSNTLKLILVFFNSMIVTTGLTFGFMFKYMTKYQTLARTDTLDAFYSEHDQPFSGKTVNQGEEMSLDPQDYGMIKYTDLEIAAHSIMVDGLPRNIPRRDLEQKLK